ncbi:sulfurtransferase complex subunit TusB [Aliikangiella marina]|uniref:Sulfurtransferase complex subunit TusB n=1 Tax=Aliikangiella marina TaxID=1712262 RepID=A0A545THK2_9GAMM|nr:sulfurtransferase complex subunit TusB [Aliikangiella marina]TQV76631.1 sulfurtransferase complex subunit TusB [Aliikangiella marina]
MSQLHLINRSMSQAELQSNFDRLVASSDSLLFIGDGVLNLVNNQLNTYLGALSSPILGLEADIRARGLTRESFQFARVINDLEMVDLTLSHQKTISW